MTENDSLKPENTVEKVVNKGGRPKGASNKLTIEFRDTVRRLLEDNAENVSKWLLAVAEGDDSFKPNPARALDLLIRLAEYAAPKLTRTEVVGDANNPLTVQTITRQIVDPLTITQDMAEIKVLTNVNGASETVSITKTTET